MVGWHHLLNGHKFEKPPGVGDGQGSLVGYSTEGCKESDMTEHTHTESRSRFLNWNFLDDPSISVYIHANRNIY